MKTLVRRLLYRLGYILRHHSTDAVVARLDAVREVLRLHPSPPHPVTLHELCQVALAAHLRALLARHTPDLVVDVGANRGQFALQVRALGFTGPILSFEPQRRHAEDLRSRAAHTDPCWTVLHAAAGESAGRLELRTFADDVFSSFHVPTAAALARFGALLQPTGREVVEIVRIDDALAATAFRDSRRILIKTDTQGHDLAVLRGAATTLKRTCIVLCEAALVPLYETGATPETLAALLNPFGFRSAGAYPISHDDSDLAVLELDCLFVRPVSPPSEPRETPRPIPPS